MAMAQVIHEKGGPENFVWENVEIAPPGAGEVRIRNLAIGVNFADTYHRAGIPHPLIVGDPPVIVGLESVSTVVETGPDVAGFAAGDKVCHFQPPLGAYAEEQIYPADKLVKVPADLGLGDKELVSVLLKGIAAQYLLHETYLFSGNSYDKIIVAEPYADFVNISDRWGRSSLHISRRRSRNPHVSETNHLDSKTLRHRRAGTFCTYSLSGKICRHSLKDHRSGKNLEQ